MLCGSDAVDLLHRAAFRGGSLGRSLVAPSRTHHTPTEETVRRFFARHITVANGALVALGVDHDLLLEFAVERLKLAPPSAALPPPATAPASYLGGEVRKECGGQHAAVALAVQGARYTHVTMGAVRGGQWTVAVFSLTDPKNQVLQALLASVLGTGPRTSGNCGGGSRLGKALRAATDAPFQVSRPRVGAEGCGSARLAAVAGARCLHGRGPAGRGVRVRRGGQRAAGAGRAGRVAARRDAGRPGGRAARSVPGCASLAGCVQEAELAAAKRRVKLDVLSGAEEGGALLRDLAVQAAMARTDAPGFVSPADLARMVDGASLADVNEVRPQAVSRFGCEVLVCSACQESAGLEGQHGRDRKFTEHALPRPSGETVKRLTILNIIFVFCLCCCSNVRINSVLYF